MPVIAPIMGDTGHEPLIESLKTRIPKLLKLGTPDAPRAIVVITPHWLPERPTISIAAEPPLLHDFEANFPPMVFEMKYKAPGSPEIAEEIYQAFSEAGLEPVKDCERGENLSFISTSGIADDLQDVNTASSFPSFSSTHPVTSRSYRCPFSAMKIRQLISRWDLRLANCAIPMLLLLVRVLVPSTTTRL